MFQKYADALNLMDLVIAAKGDIEAATIAWDNLFTFVFPNFVCPESLLKEDDTLDAMRSRGGFRAEVEEMVAMFAKNRETLEQELHKIPPAIAEVAFPVYMTWYLNIYQEVPVRLDKLTTFYEFYRRYGYMIVEGRRKQ